MASESSFDIVSKVDRQEVDNALNQAAKEVRQRFDFKNTDATIAWSGEAIELEANSEERVKAVLDVFQSKLVRRGVSLKSLDAGEPRSSGKLYKITATTSEGISQENAKKVSKLIRDEGPKGVKAQIQGDELRVSSKSRDDLQARPGPDQGRRTTTSRSSSRTTARHESHRAAGPTMTPRIHPGVRGGRTERQVDGIAGRGQGHKAEELGEKAGASSRWPRSGSIPTTTGTSAPATLPTPSGRPRTR